MSHKSFCLQSGTEEKQILRAAYPTDFRPRGAKRAALRMTHFSGQTKGR